MDKCPKCGKKLTIFNIKQECPGCGCDILYYDIEKRLEEDVKKRLSEEFGVQASVKVSVGVNENYEITGVEEIVIWTKMKSEKIRQRLTEVYSPQRILFSE